jgi:hypothetical protein
MRTAAFALAALMLCGAAAEARNTYPAERRVYAYDGVIRACDDQGVIGDIVSRFANRESTYWNSRLTITGVTRIRSTGYRPNGRDFIPRRYCSATVTTSDGRRRHLSYVLAEDAGLGGWQGSSGIGRFVWPTSGYGIEWCVSGLDRHFTYAPGCVMTRP